MIRRPPLLILPIALLCAATAACGSASTVGSAGTAGTSTASPRAATAPSTQTVTVTVTRSAEAPRHTSTGVATTTSTSTPTAASFTPFAGEWVGHTRDLTVSPSGRVEEHVGDGCCDPIIDLVLQLSDPRRVDGAWVATTRVLSATTHAGWKQTGRPAPKPGDGGRVTIGGDHILIDSITDNGFCDPDKTAPGTCGA